METIENSLLLFPFPPKAKKKKVAITFPWKEIIKREMGYTREKRGGCQICSHSFSSCFTNLMAAVLTVFVI